MALLVSDDFTETVDFVHKNDALHWGTTYILEAGTKTPGASEAFDDTQATATLIDNRFYMREASGTVDGSNDTFVVEDDIIDGTGTDVKTEEISKIAVFVGTDVQDAILGGEVVVLTIDEDTREIVLKTPPSVGEFVYVNFYRNFILDDVYTFMNTVAGVGGVGNRILRPRGSPAAGRRERPVCDGAA